MRKMNDIDKRLDEIFTEFISALEEGNEAAIDALRAEVQKDMDIISAHIDNLSLTPGSLM